MKKIIGIILLLAIIILLIVFWKKNTDYISSIDEVNIEHTTYLIEGEVVSFENGVSRNPDSRGYTTKYFGNEVREDINGDGKEDVVFLVTQEGAGTGTFYYLLAVITTNTGFQGTKGILIGDRISPQSTDVNDNGIIVNYLRREDEQPMTTPPTISVSKYFKIFGNHLVEI